MSYWKQGSMFLFALAILSFLSGLVVEWFLVPFAQYDRSAYYLTIIKYGVVTLDLLVAAVFCALKDIGDRLLERGQS